MDLIAILSGFGVGAIVGLTGVGGGSLMTPLLLTVFKLHPAAAIGTDLHFAAITKTSGSIAHHLHGHFDYRILGHLLTGSIPAAVATIALMHFTGVTKGWASALTYALGIALLLTAVTVAYKQVWQKIGLRLALGVLLIGSIPGIWIGAQLTRQLPDRLIRVLLCVSLLSAGFKVIT